MKSSTCILHLYPKSKHNMESDPGGDFTSSAIFKTTVLTVAFTSFYFFKTQKTTLTFKMPVLKQDTMSVLKEVWLPAPKKKKRTIYLTFDDGPNKGTKNVMRIVKEEQVPVTLFIIGEHVYGSRMQLAMYDSVSTCSLFEIANHSYTHAFENKYREFYEFPDSAVKDFERCADSLHLSSGIIRTPGRNIWRTDSLDCTDIKASTAAADSLYSNGFKAMGWDLEWHFNKDQRPVQTAEEMLLEIDSAFAKNKTKTTDHLVLLAHDQVYITSDDSATLHNFIIQLKKKDEYNIETVSKYPGIVQ